jgi:hypothetical protein
VASACRNESGVTPEASSAIGTTSAPSASTRSKKGGKPGDSSTTRSPYETTCSSIRVTPSVAPSTTVIASAR